MRVLVTGGAGYIGSHTAHALKRRGHEVVVYDNLSTGHAALAQGFDLIEGDICDTAKLAPILRWVDAVMHFAAYAYVGESVVNPRKYFQNNVTGGLSVLNAVVDSNVRKFIFSSTCAVYGVPVKVPITEENPRLPVNPYGVSKLMLEQALEAYEQAYGFRFVCFRYFNAAGADEEGRAGEEHDPETHLIPSVFEAVHGDRSVLGLEYLEQGNSAALNLGTGKGHSVREVISTIERVTGREVPKRMAARRAGDPPELVADPSLAEKTLHWKATRSLEQIVATAWKWSESKRAMTR